ncbi:MAG: tetratricopeptide repeat protein [Deltaproteobacteria bacterium]|nr:tetratricopeptide repeat protein [Deltaproteobacteria bacterium]
MLLPFTLLALVLYTRHPATNYIFDEQEALLANPYVNARLGLRYGDVIYRDFWGLPPEASIGSYRPLPNLVWRALWSLHAHLPESFAHLPKHPFFHHLWNVGLHALNGALLGSFAFAMSRRRVVGWVAGLTFVACAVLTEAVSGIVGLADVLGGLGAILALVALRLPASTMPLGVFAAVLFGLFAKESALVCVPLVPVAALVTAPLLHGERPARWTRAALAFTSAAAAFILYVELRKAWFPSPLPEALRQDLPEHASRAARLFREFMVWFHQAPLPKDPLNNPLVDADTPHRIAGALRVYLRGLSQLVLPLHLSGDYSFPQEPIPATLFGWETVFGGVLLVSPPLVALGLWLRGLWLERTLCRARDATSSALAESADTLRRRDRTLGLGVLAVVAGLVAILVELELIFRESDAGGVRTWPCGAGAIVIGLGLLRESGRPRPPVYGSSERVPFGALMGSLVALGLVWMVVSYFPHSNIPVVLPTVRAERFWYFPAIGSSLVLATLAAWLLERFDPDSSPATAGRVRWVVVALGAFFGFQGVRAYLHAMDYRDDVLFWFATKQTVTRSAKAHLNYSVMVGARGDLTTRLTESLIARELAPKWPMAHIYTGDTLCRMDRAEEAWPYYAEGFTVGPNEKSLISLALQCMYDKKTLLAHEEELRALAAKPTGNTWIAYLVTDTLANHEKNKGVDPQYRPRGYNEGAKE